MSVRRILFCESSANVGGQELQLLAQAKGLMQRGLQTRILCRAGSRLATLARAAGVDTQFVRFRNSLHPPSLWAVRRQIASFAPDALLCHSGHDANIGALAARLSGRRPVLLRARTYQPGMPSAFGYNRLFDRTLVPSAELRRNLLANPKIDPERIHVLYPGIDFAALAARAQEPLAPPLRAVLDRLPPRRLVHAAMLRGEKGHLTMLEVVARLAPRFPDLGYLAAGEGPMREAILARAAELGIAGRVALAGMVDTLPALLAQAELVVMPSTYEPLGMSQIEALGLGIGVVGSAVGGIPETIRHGITGLLAAPGDVDAWTMQLGQALAEPAAMRAMAQAGREDVTARFGMERNLDQLLAHIEELRADRRGGAQS